MKTALYPGSFDPLTRGHLDIIDRARRMFDRVIVAVARSARKETMFSMDDRLSMLQEVVASRQGVEVVSFHGLLVHQFEKLEVDVVVRGVRLFQDFEYEYMMALMNRRLLSGFEVIFLMPSEDYLSVSSSLIKEIHMHGGDITEQVPAVVLRHMRAAFPVEEDS